MTTTPSYPAVQLLIDGTWRDGHEGQTLAVLNPATGAEIGRVAVAQKADLDAALAAAAKGFDKLETMLQHLMGQNAPDFDYRFNLSYGRTYTDKHPLLAELRTLVDQQTRQLLQTDDPDS